MKKKIYLRKLKEIRTKEGESPVLSKKKESRTRENLFEDRGTIL